MILCKQRVSTVGKNGGQRPLLWGFFLILSKQLANQNIFDIYLIFNYVLGMAVSVIIYIPASFLSS